MQSCPTSGINSVVHDGLLAEHPRVKSGCTTDGKDCEVKSTGAKASFWYLSPNAKELTVEISSLVPQSHKVDRLVLEKQYLLFDLEIARPPQGLPRLIGR